MHIDIRVYIYIYIYIYMHIYLYIYIYIRIYMYIYTHLHLHIHTYASWIWIDPLVPSSVFCFNMLANFDQTISHISQNSGKLHWHEETEINSLTYWNPPATHNASHRNNQYSLHCRHVVQKGILPPGRDLREHLFSTNISTMKAVFCVAVCCNPESLH